MPSFKNAEGFCSGIVSYALVCLFFIIGIVAGAAVLKMADISYEGELAQHLTVFLNALEGSYEVDKLAVAQYSVFYNFATVFSIWFLGLTVVGVPLVLLIVLLKGLILGFTVGFLVRQKALSGVLFAFVSLFPQNLVFIPVLVMGAVAAISFSVYLIKGRYYLSGSSLSQQFINYSVFMVFLSLLVFLVSLYEAYVSPALMKLLVIYL